MELGLQIPYFLLTVRQEVEEGFKMDRNFFFSSVFDVQSLLETLPEDVKLIRLDILSPPHVNGSTGFQLQQLSEVWQCKSNKLYKLADGSELKYDLGTRVPRAKYVRLFSVPV